MLSTLHRLVPFLNRNHQRGQASAASSSTATATRNNNEPALTSNIDHSDAWSTLSRSRDVDELDRGANCVNGTPTPTHSPVEARATTTLNRGVGLSGRSQLRLLSGAFPLITCGRRGEYVVQEDISNGREKHKIPALSYRRNDKAPSDYHYVTEHIQIDSMNVNLSLAIMSKCDCVGDCSDGQCQCSTGHQSNRCYNSKSRLSSKYNVDAPEIIYECNAGCKCNWKSCINTVIQSGCRSRLVLFRTKSRGWGVRTLEGLKRGTFIGVYSGELISAYESTKRTDDTYLFNLANTQICHQQQQQAEEQQVQQEQVSAANNNDNCADEGQYQTQRDYLVAQDGVEDVREENQFVCDAKFYGNFTRFINHSCEPNVIGIRSFTTHQDVRFPYISFFTNKDLPANTELTLNYGDNYWLVKCKRDGVYCLCKQPSCRFTKKTFPKTLKQHNKLRQNNRIGRQQQ